MKERCEQRSASLQSKGSEQLLQPGLLAGLGESGFREVARRGYRRHYEKGDVLFCEGDQALGLHLVISGKVKVFKGSPRGRQQTLLLLGSGDLVGEVAALAGGCYPAMAQALESTETLYIPRGAFLEVVRNDPESAMLLIATLSARLQVFAKLVADLALRDVSERVAGYLLDRCGTDEELQTVKLGLSRAELARSVGAVPETLSRALRQLNWAGAIEPQGRHIKIRDRALLERFAGRRG